MPATLSDRIKNAPKGSFLRNLDGDSSSDEDDDFISVPSPATTNNNHNQKTTQETWAASQPAPEGIQTQPDPYIIPRKNGAAGEPAQQQEQRKSPRIAKTKPAAQRYLPDIIIVANTPDSGSMSPITTSGRKHYDQSMSTLVQARRQEDLQPLKRQLVASTNDVALQQSSPHYPKSETTTAERSARVSLSPAPKNKKKSRTTAHSNTHSKRSNSVISSLEALAPPAEPSMEIIKAAAEDASAASTVSTATVEETTTPKQKKMIPTAADENSIVVVAVGQQCEEKNEEINNQRPLKKRKIESIAQEPDVSTRATKIVAASISTKKKNEKDVADAEKGTAAAATKEPPKKKTKKLQRSTTKNKVLPAVTTEVTKKKKEATKTKKRLAKVVASDDEENRKSRTSSSAKQRKASDQKIASKTPPVEATAKTARTSAKSKKAAPSFDKNPSNTPSAKEEHTSKSTATTSALATESVKPKKKNVEQKTAPLQTEKSSNTTSSTDVGLAAKKDAPSAKDDKPAVAAVVAMKKKTKRTFQDQVLCEMLFSCKVYNLKTLAQTCQTTETVLQHMLLSLLDKKVILQKEFSSSKSGKTKVLYWANQESKAKEVNKLIPDAAEMQEAKRELQALYKLTAANAKEMGILTQGFSNDEIETQLKEMDAATKNLKEQLAATRARIQSFQQNGSIVGGGPKANRFQKPKSAAQLAKERCPRRLKMRINAMRSEWKSRKQKCMDFVDQLADGMEKKPKQVVQLLDFETDEMEGILEMPPKHVI